MIAIDQFIFFRLGRIWEVDLTFAKRSFSIITALLLIFLAQPLLSKANSAYSPEQLQRACATASNDSARIIALSALSKYYSDFLGDEQKADSLGSLAREIATSSHRIDLIHLACNSYIESGNLTFNRTETMACARYLERFSGEAATAGLYRSYHNLVTVYLSGFKYETALEYAYKALTVSVSANNTAWKVRSLLDIGSSLEGKNQPVEAFRNYLNATELAVGVKDPELLIACYDRLSRFYNLNKMDDDAIRYKLMQTDLILKKHPPDSIAFYWTRYDLQVIDLNSNDKKLNEKEMQEILSFALRTGHRRLLEAELNLIRSYYIEIEEIGRLSDLYNHQFPGELVRLAEVNPEIFYRLQALFSEFHHHEDSALYFFRKAEKIIVSDPNKILQSRFFSRYGEFLLRHGMTDSARFKLERSFKLAQDAGYFDFMVSSCAQLESLYAGKGDFRNAYRFSVMNRGLSDSIRNLVNKDQMLSLEIEHEAKQRELVSEQERQTVIKRHYLQYSAIIIIIISVFIILLMLGSMKVPEWIIRMLGFFSFILLFEFIVLLADHKIHDLTAGEPWKILLIKIFLIAVLLPMHHWIEKRVVAFLLDPALVNISKIPMKSKIRKLVRR